MKKVFIIVFAFTLLILCGCKRTFKVTFEVFDDITEYQIVAKGDKIKSFTPTLDGYTFIAWVYDDEEFDEDTKINKNITLQAKWVKNDYTVKFISDGETFKEEKVEYGDILKSPTEDPVKEDYIFLGWFYNGSIYSFDKKVTSNMTLNAILVKDSDYTPNIKISFNSTGAKVTLADITVKRLDEIPELPTVTYDGHTFLGWYLGDERIEEGDILKEISDFTLVAKWQ